MSATLSALLDTLLPGGEGFPAASKARTDEWLAGEARFRETVERTLALLPEGFAGFSDAGRTKTLRDIETNHRELFDAMVVAAYSAYYTRPAVLGVIAALCGYKSGPPQPGGYDLPAFDPEILAVSRSRLTLWRDPKTEKRG